MTDEPLSSGEIEVFTSKSGYWSEKHDALVAEFEFENYRDAVFFANTVFGLSESAFHHPSVTVEYGSVEIVLWSHDVEAITERDTQLAGEIEQKYLDMFE